ncbi:M56 family metallopeptidase [Nocardiopsis rhodophaea]|uniref:M56 family metallopeptidase n=1 Tax=Nocardiopsis rhodophaea TaxID=280238 RepID=UPI0031E37B52
MIIALLLLGYGLLLAVFGPLAVRRARWAERAPRLGIAAWQALSVAFLASLVLGGLALSVPDLRLDTGLAQLLDACLAALRAQYATPDGMAIDLSGIGLALLLGLRCAWSVARTLRRAVADRRRHVDALRVLARRDRVTGAMVLEHALPAAYCLPGNRGQVVLTSGALDALSPEQLQAVLAHEHAHLRGRHDLVAAAAIGMADAFPGLPLFRVIRDETLRLLELAADDAAARTTHRLVAAEALLNVADHRSPAGAFAAGGPGTGARIQRLIIGVVPLGRVRALLVGTLAIMPIAVPLALFAGPAAALADSTCCPTDIPTMRHPVEVCASMPNMQDCLTLRPGYSDASNGARPSWTNP